MQVNIENDMRVFSKNVSENTGTNEAPQGGKSKVNGWTIFWGIGCLITAISTVCYASSYYNVIGKFKMRDKNDLKN